MSIAFFKKGKGKFGKNEDEKIESSDIYLLKLPTTTSELINNGEDGINPYISALDLSEYIGNAIIAGGDITLIEGYKYAVPVYKFIIRGQVYKSLPTTITLNPSHVSLNRIDSFILTFNTLGEGMADVLVGVESASAIKREINTNTQIEITFVPVDFGTTTPSIVTNLTVYNENIEFTTAAVVTGTIDFDAVSNPYNLTKHILVTGFVSGDEITFKNGSTFSPYDYSGLHFFIEPTNGLWDANSTLEISFYNDVTQVSEWVTIDSTFTNNPNNPYAFNSNIAEYQIISIPIAQFIISGIVADGFKLRTSSTVGVDFNLDFFRLQIGVVSPRPTATKTKTSEFINDGNGDINNPFITIDDVTNTPNLQKIVTASTYTILDADNKYTIFFINATGVTVTLDTLSTANFECSFYNDGVGDVIFQDGTATLDVPDGAILATDKVAALIRKLATTTYKLKGELTT